MKYADMVQKSKFLSLILRHDPARFNVMLDDNGFADVTQVLAVTGLTKSELYCVVANNDKQRFSFSSDKQKIRAVQGHSIKVDLQLTEKIPPETLFHGTAKQNVHSIVSNGINKGERNYVHLSADVGTAQKVGQRHGEPVVLIILAGAMQRAGYRFYQSENGIWLTEKIPPKFIQG